MQSPINIFLLLLFFQFSVSYASTEHSPDTTHTNNFPPIKNLYLIDAGTDQVLFELVAGSVINTFLYPDGLNLQVVTSDSLNTIGSIYFSLEGPSSINRAEGKAPYALFGDTNGNYRPHFFRPGDYSLSVAAYTESGGRGSVLDTRNIQFAVINQEQDPCESSPQLSLQDSASIRCNEARVELLAEASEEGRFSWSGPASFEANTAKILVGTVGRYELTFTTNTGCELKGSTVITQQAPPSIGATFTQPIPCSGGSSRLILLTEEEGEARWSGPDGFISTLTNPLIDEAGTYTVQFTNSLGCQSMATVDVPLKDAPILEVEAQGGINCSNDPIQLVVSSNKIGTFKWEGPDNFSANTPEILAEIPGTYTVLFKDVEGCEVSEEIVVVAIVNPTVSAGEDVRLSCQSFTANLSARTLEEGTILWTGPNDFSANSKKITVSNPGIYTLTFRNQQGCEATDEVEVFPAIIPALVIADKVEIPCGEEGLGLQAGINTVGSFKWKGPNKTDGIRSTLYVTRTGTYTVDFVSEDGCSDSKKVEVVNEKYDPFISFPDRISFGCTDSVQLTVNLEPYCGLQWSGPNDFVSRLPTPKVGQAGTYDLTVRSEGGCESSKSLVVDESDYDPVISIPERVFLDCANPSSTIEVKAANYDQIQWTGPENFLSTELSPIVNQEGTYTLKLISGEDCFRTYQVEVAFSNAGFSPVSSIQTQLSLDCSTLTANMAIVAAGYFSFSWTGPNGFSSSQLNPVVTEAGTYTITFQGTANCEASYSIVVRECTPEPVCDIPRIHKVLLINADTDLEIQPLTDGSIINLAEFPYPLNVNAVPEDCEAKTVNSVRFELQGPLELSRTESAAPFALGGDNRGDYLPLDFKIGNYQLSLTPFSEKGAKGISGLEKVINFRVVNVLNGSSGFDSAPHGIGTQTNKRTASNKEFSHEDRLSVSVVPNPASRKTTVWVEGAMAGETEVYITDILGKRIYSQKAEKNTLIQQFILPLTGLSQGVFFVNVKIGQQLVTEKMIIKQ
ncbi:MAG: T9SS type A sorting domain-containing protein [Bacteroidota bacterium]